MSEEASGHETRASDQTARNRDQPSSDHGQAADKEDTASDRDPPAGTASERDEAATVETDRGTNWQDILLRAADDRERAAADRERAADDRAQAAADREIARQERAEASRIRSESAGLLEQAATDQLTGARTRFLGLDEALRELERTRRRPGAALMVAFVDVDGLKRINDSRGHLAGDALLRLVGQTLIANLRRYDVVVRYGGDEFVCAMPEMSPADACARFRTISLELAAVDPAYSISIGLAQSRAEDGLEDLISRADSDLLDGRSRA
jgi:diguanylate cyclase (GGDEF)-like protein